MEGVVGDALRACDVELPITKISNATVLKMDATSLVSSRQVQIRFATKLRPPLKAPTSSIAVPSNLTRMGLSEIVNLLLKNVNSEFEPQPFDFLIDGELVWMSLEQFLLEKGISTERVLEIEYIKAIAPPGHSKILVCVTIGFILTGCYDNFSRLWKAGASCTHILEGHTSAVSSVSILSTKGVESGHIHLVTGSKDRTLRLWMFDALENVDHVMKIRAYRILKGHSASVQSISSAPSGDMVCSGLWDYSIKLWNVKDSETEGDFVSIKKRKLVSDTAEESQSEGYLCQPSLDIHNVCLQLSGQNMRLYIRHHGIILSKVGTSKQAKALGTLCKMNCQTPSFMNPSYICFLNTASPLSLQVCGKALNCLDVGGDSSALVAAGGSDPILRIWDPRKPGSLAPVFQFSSHSSWITACKWNSRSWHHLVSASYDGKVMLWDLRTAWPLAVIDSQKDKVLCADWWKDDSVISGGADSELCISSGISVQ